MSNNRWRTRNKIRTAIRRKRLARLRKKLREVYLMGVEAAKKAAVVFSNFNSACERAMSELKFLSKLRG